MRLATLRRSRSHQQLPGLHGTARVARRAAAAARRAKPGDIAVLEHQDLDGTSAQLLVDAGVAAVVNAAPSISGRYPNRGPQVLVEAGIPLLDHVGPEVFARLDDGEKLRLDGETLFRGEEVVATGHLMTPSSVDAAMGAARGRLGAQLEAFAHATTEHLRRERDLLLDGSGAPALRTRIEGRPVVVVARARGVEAELKRLGSWLKANRPVLVAVDEAADAVLAMGLRPDLVVGDPRLVSDDVLDCGAEIVVRADRDGSAPGLHRAEQAGVEPVVFATSGSDDDAALLLVDAQAPALVVGVGWHPSLAALVDSGRAVMPSAFLTRLRLGDRFVDSATVLAVHRRPARTWPLWLLCLVLLAALAAVVALAPDASPVGEHRDQVVQWVQDTVQTVRQNVGQSVNGS
jgi:uncharacterized membrane-anchored protein